MKVKNNYNECITNLACSIRKYFELDYSHNTLNYIDQLLEKEKPKNVVVILYDGMGSRIIDRHLNKEDFFINNKYKEITTVFPATTTAAITSIRTGLNPIEHGWLGWNVYIDKIDETITLFMNEKKETKEISKKFIKEKENLLVTKTIADEINQKGKYKALELFPFGEKPYKNIDDMINIIKKECNTDEKKYIYAYDDEPDHTMHDSGPDSDKVKELIKIRNKKTEELSKKLKDTLLIIVADHGHTLIDNIFLKNYPKLMKMLERTTSIEQRATSFKVKKGKKEKFQNEFNKLFGDYYKLYSKEEIINSKIFGDGKENKVFKNAIGDFIAIAQTEKNLVNIDDDALISHHAGYTDDEIFIPLIIKMCR